MFSPGTEFTAQWLQLFQQETMESLLVPKIAFSSWSGGAASCVPDEQ